MLCVPFSRVLYPVAVDEVVKRLVLFVNLEQFVALLLRPVLTKVFGLPLFRPHLYHTAKRPVLWNVEVCRVAFLAVPHLTVELAHRLHVRTPVVYRVEFCVVLSAVRESPAQLAECDVVNLAYNAQIPTAAVNHVGVPKRVLEVRHVAYPHILASAVHIPHDLLHRPARNQESAKPLRVKPLLVVEVVDALDCHGQLVYRALLVGVVRGAGGYLVLLPPHAHKHTHKSVEHVVRQRHIPLRHDAVALLAAASVLPYLVTPLVTNHIAVVPSRALPELVKRVIARLCLHQYVNLAVAFLDILHRIDSLCRFLGVYGQP